MAKGSFPIPKTSFLHTHKNVVLAASTFIASGQGIWHVLEYFVVLPDREAMRAIFYCN